MNPSLTPEAALPRGACGRHVCPTAVQSWGGVGVGERTGLQRQKLTAPLPTSPPICVLGPNPLQPREGPRTVQVAARLAERRVLELWAPNLHVYLNGHVHQVRRPRGHREDAQPTQAWLEFGYIIPTPPTPTWRGGWGSSEGEGNHASSSGPRTPSRCFP